MVLLAYLVTSTVSSSALQTAERDEQLRCLHQSHHPSASPAKPGKLVSRCVTFVCVCVCVLVCVCVRARALYFPNPPRSGSHDAPPLGSGGSVSDISAKSMQEMLTTHHAYHSVYAPFSKKARFRLVVCERPLKRPSADIYRHLQATPAPLSSIRQHMSALHKYTNRFCRLLNLMSP